MTVLPQRRGQCCLREPYVGPFLLAELAEAQGELLQLWGDRAHGACPLPVVDRDQALIRPVSVLLPTGQRLILLVDGSY